MDHKTMDDNVYTPPKSDLGPPSIDDGNLATRGSRLVAALLDALMVLPITGPLVYFTGGFDGITTGVQPSISYTIIMTAIGILVFLLIHGYFLISNGQTLGKKALGIKIVTHDNQHASVMTLAKRYGFYWLIPQIPVVGILLNFVNLLLIFGKPKKCIHDYVGGTIVIKASPQA